MTSFSLGCTWKEGLPRQSPDVHPGWSVSWRAWSRHARSHSGIDYCNQETPYRGECRHLASL